MKTFKKIYLWAMYAKFYMGIYFVALTVLTGAMHYIYGHNTVDLMMIFQILGVSVVLAILQTVLLDGEMTYGKGIFSLKTVGWLIGADLIIVGSAWLGGWMETLPTYTLYGLGVLMFMGLVAMLVGQKWEQDMDTVKLNQDLKTYQSSERNARTKK